jgi:hypothetical protein
MSSLNFPARLCTDQNIPVCTTDVQVHTHHDAVHGNFTLNSNQARSPLLDRRDLDAEGPGCKIAGLLGQSYGLQRDPGTCKNVSIHKYILESAMYIPGHTQYIPIRTTYIHYYLHTCLYPVQTSSYYVHTSTYYVPLVQFILGGRHLLIQCLST